MFQVGNEDGIGSRVLPADVVMQIEQKWIARVQARKVKTKGNAYDATEAEFFIGAMEGITALDPRYALPLPWVLSLLDGKPIINPERFAKDVRP